MSVEPPVSVERPTFVERSGPAGPRPAGVLLRAVQVGGEWLGSRAGGLNRYFSGLVRHLPAAGVEPRATAAGARGADDPPGTSFAPADAPLGRRLLAARREVRRLRDGAGEAGSADLVVGHFAPYLLPALPGLGVPAVVHFHGPWADESRAEGGGAASASAKRAAERLVYRRADRLVALSEAFAGVLVERYGVDRGRVSVVPGGIDVGDWASRAASAGTSRADARRSLGWPADRPVVLCVRRLARRTGVDLLINAVQILRAEHPDLLVMVAGTGDLAGELEGRIDAAGLRGRVRLLGFAPDADLPAMYRAADVSVVPSRSLEGFGLTTLESLAAGTPVVVTPIGGLPEAVGGLDRRLIAGAATAEALAGALGRALGRPGDLPDAAACERYARDHFDWPVIASRVAAVYRRAVGAS